MNKPLKYWSFSDMLEFFEKEELTPQQIMPLLGCGAIDTAQMADINNKPEMSERYRRIIGEISVIIGKN